MADAHYPGRPSIDAYGSSGFRFADMSHKGSILILPSGVYGWDVKAADKLSADDFTLVLAEADEIDFLLLGTGEAHVPVDASLREVMRGRAISVDIMSTGAAARTWNIVLAEGRLAAAALIAVE